MSSLDNLIKYFFARDLLNYARLMTVHLAQMNALEEDDPETWNALKSAFVVAKSEIPFTHLFTDQALEQEIKKLKGRGGMVGLSRDEAGLDRLVTSTPHIATLVEEYLNKFPHSFQIFCEDRTLSALRGDCAEIKSKCSEDSGFKQATLRTQSI